MTPTLSARLRLAPRVCAAILLVAHAAAPARAQAPARPAPTVPAPGSAAATPVVMEYYYRIRWGSAGEFKRLYFKNHAPLLEAMRQLGFVKSVVVQEPFTHMAGGPRWDLRVTITFRDAAAAISDPEWDRQWELATKRLYANRAAFEAEERDRFALLEDHWDIVVNPVTP